MTNTENKQITESLILVFVSGGVSNQLVYFLKTWIDSLLFGVITQLNISVRRVIEEHIGSKRLSKTAIFLSGGVFNQLAFFRKTLEPLIKPQIVSKVLLYCDHEFVRCDPLR